MAPKTFTELILASGSPYRAQLLQSTGLVFRVESSKLDEKTITNLEPRELARARGIAKARDVASRNPDALVIGADQVLGFGGRAYDKASTSEEAAVRLREFSGKSHILYSAYCLVWSERGGVERSGVGAKVLEDQVIDVPMHLRTLTESEISAYVSTGEWQGCVGCYQAENRGVHLLERVGGDSSAVIGLPLLELLSSLRKVGVDGLLAPEGPWVCEW